MSDVKIISIINTEVIVDTDLGNLSFFSMKVAMGKKSIAIKKAKKKGANILWPNTRRYPIPMIDTTTRVRLTRKGSFKKFIMIRTIRIKIKDLVNVIGFPLS